jgi:hypothetical protein
MSEQNKMNQKCQAILKQLEGLSLDEVNTLLANVEYQIGKSGVVAFTDIESVQYQSDLKPKR